MSNTNLALVTSHFPQKIRLLGNRKRKLMKLKVMYPHNLFCVLKHVYKKSLCNGVHNATPKYVFIYTAEGMCTFLCKSLPS